MGLLDDAIREHLELKRRHGASPEDVARAEREALGPAVRERVTPAPAPADEMSEDDAPAELGPAGAGLGEEGRGEDEPIPALDEPPSAPAQPAAAPLQEQASSSTVAETPSRPAETPEPPAPGQAPVEAEAGEQAVEPESAVAPPDADEAPVDQPTEMFDAGEIFADEDDEAFPTFRPSRPADEAPAAPAGNDEPPPRSPAARDRGEEDKPDDVLEETPEFLQETPEHDRLWFEQKPPRDFDFDK